jgi:hypothetical protein
MRPVKTMNMAYSSQKISRKGALKWIHDCFEPEDVIMALCAIGDCLADFGNKRLFILYGPGGIGKSAAANLIFQAVNPQASALPADLLKSYHGKYVNKRVEEEAIYNAASSRIMNAGDVNIESSKGQELEMQWIKILTGGDNFNGMSVSVTLLAGANELALYKNMSEFTRADHVRRITVIPTRQSRNTSDNSQLPMHSGSLNELLQFAIRTRVRFEYPPLSPKAMLCTLFQGRYVEAMQIVDIVPNASVLECLMATVLLMWYFDLQMREVQNSLQRVGSNCCVCFCGSLYIAGIAPRYGISFADLSIENDSVNNNGNNKNGSNNWSGQWKKRDPEHFFPNSMYVCVRIHMCPWYFPRTGEWLWYPVFRVNGRVLPRVARWRNPNHFVLCRPPHNNCDLVLWIGLYLNASNS